MTHPTPEADIVERLKIMLHGVALPLHWQKSDLAGKAVDLKREHWKIGSAATLQGLGLIFGDTDRLARLIVEAINALPALIEKIEDYRRSFDLQWKAMRRGTELWRIAHPGNDLVLPDTGKLVEWLIGELDRLRAAPPASRGADGVREALDEVMGWIDSWSPQFTFDDEWQATANKVRDALASTVTPGGSSSGEGAVPFDKAAGAMFGLPWHLAPWGDGSEPAAVVNICSESHKAVIAENVEREEADFIIRACNAYSLKPEGPEATGEQVRSEAKPSEPVPSPQAQVVEALRSALINLNVAIDAMWNDPWRLASNRWPDHQKRICAAQQDAAAALATHEEGDGK